MTKKIISLVLAVLLCMVFTIPAFAAPELDYVTDEFNVLGGSEIELLNSEAAGIYDKYSVGVFFVYTYTEAIEDYDLSAIVGDVKDYAVMVENETSWYLHLGGIAADVIDLDMEKTLRDFYDEASTYYDGVSAFFNETAKLFPVTGETENSGGEVTIPTTGITRLHDGADLLTDAEEATLLAKLDKISQTYQVDVAVATVDGTGNMSVDKYVNYYFDNSGLGFGPARDGVLLLVDMDSRNFRILSNGKELGAAAISSGDIDSITDKITPDLSDGNYADAFHTFADECEYQINGEINGFPFDYGKKFLISLAIGVVIALIATGSMKGQLKSVRSQKAAANYVKAGSLSIVDARERFLYSSISRTEKESKSSGSSGGSSRNVGGGSF